MKRHLRSWRVLAAFGGLALLAASGAIYHAGSLLARPASRFVGEAPGHLPLAEVRFRSGSGSELRGWFARGEPGRGGVVLLHGLRADRRSMLRRAAFLDEAGYSVLLFDFQAHGESDGERITFGALEALDAQAAVRFLRRRLPGEPLGAIGTSLGGAACLVGAEPLGLDALVLEAVYADVREAIRNRLRLRLGPLGSWLEPLLTVQMKARMGIDPDALRPIDAVSRLRSPALFVAGEVDRRTTPAEVEKLFEAAPHPKAMWTVRGAAHVDFHRHAGKRYEAVILDFLRGHMGGRVTRSAVDAGTGSLARILHQAGTEPAAAD